MVEQKDVMIADAAAAATVAGFALVLFGFLAALPEDQRNRVRSLAMGALGTFFGGLLSTIASLQWLYAKAPEAVWFLATGKYASPPFLYQTAWVTLILTVLALIYTGYYGFLLLFRR